MRGFALDALEYRNGAAAPDLHALAALDALKYADIFDRQRALLALVANAACAADDSRFRRHNGLEFADQR